MDSSIHNGSAPSEPATPNRLAWIGGFVLVCLVFAFMSRAKILTLRNAPNYDPTDDAGLFWTENAFHYRYARMAATGAGIPEVDTRMQHPEGMHVLRDEMPMMERFAGLAYRRFAAQGAPFHVFLLTLVCIYSSLIIFPAYLLAAHAWGRPGAGLVAALFYALTYSFIGPVVLGSYVRQDFALPFLFLGTHFFIAGAETGGWRKWAAGAFTAFSFASWHLSQFYYLVLLAGVVALYVIRPARRERLAQSVAAMTLVLVGVSLFVQPLRSGGLPFSTAMLAGYALLGAHYALKERAPAAWQRALIFLAAFVALSALAAWLFGGHAERYSHVYRLVLDKLRFLGAKPADPSLLSFESRVMWTSSFLSPSLEVMARWMNGAWLAAAAALALVLREGWRERTVRPAGALILWMAAVFVVLFALIHRMDIFASFFVCVLAGRAFPRNWRSATGLAALAAIALLLGLSYRGLTQAYMVSGSPLPERLKPLLQEIRRHTRPDDVILASFPLSPVICAYTDRPVVLHSKFENRRVREKVREFYAALFGSEEDFFRFCRTYGVRYFVYDPTILLNLSTESMRYIADRLDLEDDAAAVRLHLLPESLARFGLVYQSDQFRVFEVLDTPRAPGPVPFERLPIYDSRQFRREELRIREH
ncbi:MAG: Q-cell neuroblast polarization [Verrucomicrobia bacterium ADurb.Bin345]|nr:MAG: Q-cell neuroblast polarization [Verrucomicrobia bacterium ADurb.Bin345]